MTEQLHIETDKPVSDAEIEATVRQVVVLMRGTDREVIRLAADVGSRLPRFGVVEDEAVALQSLHEQIRQRIIDTTSTVPSRQ